MILSLRTDVIHLCELFAIHSLPGIPTHGPGYVLLHRLIAEKQEPQGSLKLGTLSIPSLNGSPSLCVKALAFAAHQFASTSFSSGPLLALPL
jgi:hypothetical protein